MRLVWDKLTPQLPELFRFFLQLCEGSFFLTGRTRKIWALSCRSNTHPPLPLTLHHVIRRQNYFVENYVQNQNCDKKRVWYRWKTIPYPNCVSKASKCSNLISVPSPRQAHMLTCSHVRCSHAGDPCVHPAITFGCPDNALNVAYPYTYVWRPPGLHIGRLLGCHQSHEGPFNMSYSPPQHCHFKGVVLYVTRFSISPFFSSVNLIW